MKESAKYAKIVEWSEEDQCYIGSAPGLVLGGSHGKDEKAVFEEYRAFTVAKQHDLVVLEDDRRFFPPYEAAAMVGARLQREREVSHIAVAVDVRNAASLPRLLPLVDQLRREGTRVLPIFLESRTDTLVKRYSETRRRHPLSTRQDAQGTAYTALFEAIETERMLLADVQAIATVIDTSDLRPAQLRSWVRQLVGAAHSALTLIFESFAFKHGVPRDADLVFDLRILPNPHYVKELRPLTGRDEPVAAFLREQPEVAEMIEHIEKNVAIAKSFFGSTPHAQRGAASSAWEARSRVWSGLTWGRQVLEAE